MTRGSDVGAFTKERRRNRKRNLVLTVVTSHAKRWANRGREVRDWRGKDEPDLVISLGRRLAGIGRGPTKREVELGMNASAGALAIRESEDGERKERLCPPNPTESMERKRKEGLLVQINTVGK